ncbi:MAG: LutB/LldF family L-lactate oxidation iron-sulfur protein, partial [Nitrospinota bacterium]
MKPGATFDERAGEALADLNLQEALGRVTARFRELMRRAFSGVPAPDSLRARARESRERTFQELDRHLERLVGNVERAGGRVHFVRTAEEACRLVVELARSRGVKTAVKSKSMASEELELNHALEAAGIRAHETDMGEWIIQLAGERPSHLIAPAVHKTRAQVAELFRQHAGAELGEDAETLTALARRTLRQYFLEAEMGVSGVNFAVAETGTLVLVTNEGNGRMVTTLPRVHVAIMGIEKVVPSLEDLMTLLAVLPRSATGQKLTSYVTLLTGPRKPGERDGPEELHLVILDAGRTRHLGGAFQEAFHCIRCGACLNVCPVYTKVGGHSYNSVYSGPIGSILTPMLRAGEGDLELPTASSLCGACLEACPVMVDIPRMLLEMREVRVDQRKAPL